MINQSLRSNIYPIQQEQGIHSFQLLREYYICIHIYIYGERIEWKWIYNTSKYVRCSLKSMNHKFTALNAHISKEEKSG